MLVLSLFPGIGLLDRAFEEIGFCVVRGPDILWGGDIHRFTPPPHVFDGIIGGPPCQAFSLAGYIRPRKRRENLIPEFERVVAAAAPNWFVMENVPRAPIPRVAGFETADYLLQNRWFGSPQLRKRRFTFGFRGGRKLLLIMPSIRRASRITRAVLASDGRRGGKGMNMPGRNHTLCAERFSVPEACELQGLPRDFLADSPFTVEGKYRVIGNGVPLQMGLAVARAVFEAVGR